MATHPQRPLGKLAILAYHSSLSGEGGAPAMILNENLNWAQIVAAKPQDGGAFRGVPNKVLVPKNQMLCRFITTESRRKDIVGNHVFFSPWWTEWKETVSMLSRFKSAAPKDIVRGQLAVTHDYSRELDSLVQIILTEAVFAWKGIAQYQHDKEIGVTYIGGGTQLYLPNLASDPNGLSSRVAYLHCFTSVDSLS